MDVTALHFVFDGMPGPDGPRLIEVEDSDGRSVDAGAWRARADGTAELVVPAVRLPDLPCAVPIADTVAEADTEAPPEDAQWDTPGCRATPE